MTLRIDEQELRARFRGELIFAGAAGYDEARAVFNRRIDAKPLLIARPVDDDDVALALAYSTQEGAGVYIRGGGRNVAGYATGPGVVIDLGLLRDVQVDPDTKVATFGGGARASDVLRATQAHGLAAVTGVAGHIGAGGLTLGGGIGWLSPRYGFACDNIIAANLVTVDGTKLHVDGESDPELLWALRGAGANFGVVTSLTVKVHPVRDQVLAGDLTFDAAKSREVVQRVRELNEDENEDFFVFLTYRRADLSDAPLAPGQAVLTVSVCHLGEPAQADAAIARLRALGPAVDAVRLATYLDLHLAQDDTYPEVRQHWAAEHVADMDDDIVEICEAVAGGIQGESIVVAYPFRRSMSDSLDDRGAFACRDTGWDVTTLAFWRDIAHDDSYRTWADSLSEAIREAGLVSTGVYPSMLSSCGPDRLREYYGDDRLERLRAVKDRLDPRNVLSHNANITPTPAGGQR
ncbi:FAD-binding oxidoreductase [Micromonospora sp. NPDC048830]|uniref:FAD-binding oxidoreductase n=1 Tax=Micromonospora sp. NPDC048830 TaxID=3364257 RepID=UPI0037223741